MDQLKYVNNIFYYNPKVCPAYCDCKFPKSSDLISYVGNVLELVKCKCGEEDWHNKQWLWHKGDTDAHINGPDITFHPVYSQGTAIVRGDIELSAGMVHFWEMRIITPLIGTDEMFGVGTDDVDLQMYQFHFTSPLGMNKKSWGYSYHGRIQYNGNRRLYGEQITQGCILGVYLDRFRGYIEYFLNRRSLGKAYINIPTTSDVKLYPMVASTAAKFTVRLINSTSQPATLQLYAFKALSKDIKSLKCLQNMPGFRKLLRDYWFLTLPTRYSQSSTENDMDLLDLAVLPKNTRLKRRPKRNVYTIQEDDEDEHFDKDIHDIHNEDDDEDDDDNNDDMNFYSNSRELKLHQRGGDFEFFDEFFHAQN